MNHKWATPKVGARWINPPTEALGPAQNPQKRAVDRPSAWVCQVWATVHRQAKASMYKCTISYNLHRTKVIESSISNIFPSKCSWRSWKYRPSSYNCFLLADSPLQILGNSNEFNHCLLRRIKMQIHHQKPIFLPTCKFIRHSNKKVFIFVN